MFRIIADFKFGVKFGRISVLQNSKKIDQLTLNTNDSTINFFAIADWGGLPVIFRTPSQQSIADQMALLGPQLNTKFQLGLGDNFYCKQNYTYFKNINEYSS